MGFSKSERAKQFMAFDALKGLKEAYKEKEIICEERKELSEESNMELNNKIAGLKMYDIVEVRYYKNRQYINKIGQISKIDNVRKTIEFKDETKIKLNDIIELKI